MEAIIGIFGLTFFLVLIALSFIPVIIAVVRKHNDTILIFLVTFFLGWTLIGWIIAFIWSLSSNVQGNNQNNNPTNKSLTDEINELSLLLKRKLITQEEHDEKRRKILEKN